MMIIIAVLFGLAMGFGLCKLLYSSELDENIKKFNILHGLPAYIILDKLIVKHYYDTEKKEFMASTYLSAESVDFTLVEPNVIEESENEEDGTESNTRSSE